MASVPRAEPVDTTAFAAATASGPCVWTASMIAGKFVPIVVTSAVICAEALPVHWRLTVGGVHVALALAWLWQLAWQFALALHDGGVICPSHVGAVAVPVHPPLQVALAPQLTPAFPVMVQLPLHVPLQVPAQ